MNQLNPHVANVPQYQTLLGGAVVFTVMGSWVVRLPEFNVIPSFAFLVAVVVVLAALATVKRWCWARAEAGFGVYFFALALLLSVLALGAHEPAYSSSRAVAVSLFSFAAFIAVYRLARYALGGAVRLHRRVNLGLSVFLIVLLVGYVVSPDFRGGSGGLRLTGGVNANTVGLYAFVFVVWAVLSRVQQDGQSRSARTLELLALFVLFLSFSRAAWLATFVFYLSFYSLGFSWRGFLRPKKKVFLWSGLVLFGVLTAGSLIASGAMQPIGQVVDYLDSRIGGDIQTDGNFQSRMAAWSLMWEGFFSSPLVGSFGWYGATHAIAEARGVTEFGASSPHNLHLRLLSEVGLIGYFSVMAVPVIMMASSLRLASHHTSRNSRNAAREKKTGLVLFSSIFSLFFARELFEDSYLVGMLGFGTVFALFLFACVLVLKENGRHRKVV